MNSLQRTPLYDWHIAQSARMVEFGGWEMPIQYSSVIQEHEAVRTQVGVTDVSHMGRLIVEGPDARCFLDSVLTRDIASLKKEQIRYSLLTNADGGIVDDLLVGLMESNVDGELYYFLVVNASNRLRDIEIIKDHLDGYLALSPGKKVRLIDETFDCGMIAIQGPRSVDLLQPFVNVRLADMKYYNGTETHLTNGGRWGFVSRTGYTGEDGFEVSIESFLLEQFVEQLFEAGRSFGVTAVGLGARDTLRLEAAMPLYGHELTEEINPFEADLTFAVKLDGVNFPGRKALIAAKEEPLKKIRIGLEMSGKRPAREGCDIYFQDRKIGWITSGTFSPTLQKPIAMGYVVPEFSEPGRSLLVDIRGKMYEANVVLLPFYTRNG